MASEDVYSTATANREEATRAKEIALQKLQQKDWQAAKRLFLKAQRLCPDLEGVVNCIVVAEVHIIAEATLQTTPYREIIRDYYAILDAPHDVSKKDLVQLYKKRAFQLHPDKNQYPGAEAAFKLLGEAFAVLKDDDKRRKHDIQRHHRLNTQNGGRPAGGQPHPPPRQPGAPPQNRGPYAQPFGGGSWLPNFFSGGGGNAGFSHGARAPLQRPAGGVPRDSSGSTFAGYPVNEQGGPVHPGRVPVAANQPGGAQQRPGTSAQFTAQQQSQWSGMRPGAQPGSFAPQAAGGSFQPGVSASQRTAQPTYHGNLGTQPGIPVSQPGGYGAPPGVPLTRPVGSMPQQGASAYHPGAFVGQPGLHSSQPRPFPPQHPAPNGQPTATGPTGRSTGQAGPFPAQPTGAQSQPGVYPGASSAMQPGVQFRPAMAPPGRYTARCPACSQMYTFPLAAKDKWVRCQRCKAAFKASEDLPGVAPGGVPGVAMGAPAGPLPAHVSPSPRTPPSTAGTGTFAGTAGGGAGAFPAAAGSAGASAGPSSPAPLSRVQQAWDEAVKIRTDQQKEKRRKARQLKKDEKQAEKKERDLELDRLRAARDEVKQARAEEKIRRQQSRDKADADSRAKVTAEDEHIPLRSKSKPINVDSINSESAHVESVNVGEGGVNGLPKGALGGLDPDAEDEPLVRRRKGKLQKVGETEGVSSGLGVSDAGLGATVPGLGAKEAGLGSREAGLGVKNPGLGVKEAGLGGKEAGLGFNEVAKGGESEGDPLLRKRKGTESGGKGGATEGEQEGKSKEKEGSQREGLAAGAANGSEDRRKRRRVSYIELSDGEEDVGLEDDVRREDDVKRQDDVRKQRADKGKAKVVEPDNGSGLENGVEEDVSVTWEELKGRTGLGEGSTAAIEGDPSVEGPTVDIQDDPLGEVLPGREGRKHRSLAKILSVKSTFKLEDLPTETRTDRSFLLPARSLRLAGASVNPPLRIERSRPSDEKTAGVKRPLPEAAIRAATPSPEEETGPSEAGEGAGGDSHQEGDEAGPSDANGLPVEDGEGDSIPDTVFFDFDEARKESDVRKGEFWALYDDQDSMPRFYARVNTVSYNPFQGTLTWFEAAEQTRESFAARLPGLAARTVSPGVGKFAYGITSDFDSINTFAYRQTAVEEQTGGGVKLLPRCGEVWAMFRPEKGTKRGQEGGRIGYNMVLIARADGGFAVTRLVHIPGQKSLFQPVQDAAGEQQKVAVKAADMPLFSHRVLAKKVPSHLIEYTGPARDVEIWELDLAELPPDNEF